MASGGIGVEYSLRGLPKMLPGLLLCIAFGWLALQWDHTTHRWAGEFKEAQSVIKSKSDGKSFATYDTYRTAKQRNISLQ